MTLYSRICVGLNLMLFGVNVVLLAAVLFYGNIGNSFLRTIVYQMARGTGGKYVGWITISIVALAVVASLIENRRNANSPYTGKLAAVNLILFIAVAAMLPIID